MGVFAALKAGQHVQKENTNMNHTKAKEVGLRGGPNHGNLLKMFK